MSKKNIKLDQSDDDVFEMCQAIVTDLGAVTSLINEIRTGFTAHTHTVVVTTTGTSAITSSSATSVSASAVTLISTSD